MTRRHCRDGLPLPEVGAASLRRAVDGKGLIVTEGGHVEASGLRLQPKVTLFRGRRAVAAWRRIIEPVRAAGARIEPQRWHPLSPEPAAKLSAVEAGVILGAFLRAAVRAIEAGFDGVQIQCGGKCAADLPGSVETGDLLLTGLVRGLRQTFGSEAPVLPRSSEWRRSDGFAPLAESLSELCSMFAPSGQGSSMSTLRISLVSLDLRGRSATT